MAPVAMAYESIAYSNGPNDTVHKSPVNGYISDCFSNGQLPDRSSEELHDLLCIGFGPASLAVAVAIHDQLESKKYIATEEPKVKFLEKQASFGWHAGMLLPGAKMQISFIKDLATLRDPRSKFTFLNYLKSHNRLVQFSNLDTFLPLRIEFEDYLKWCAQHFNNSVEYSQEVLKVRPFRRNGGGKFDSLEVTTRDLVSGQLRKRFGRNVIIAVGGRPSKPTVFAGCSAHVIHSSEYHHKISKILPHTNEEYDIAVIGGGQSAAEIFSDLHSRFSNARTRLVIRDTALRPSDDSPFVNEVFNPEAVDSFYSSCPEARRSQLRSNKATNYSVVRIGLLEKIYEELYHQRIRQSDPSLWRHQILSAREVTKVIDSNYGKGLDISLRDLSSNSSKTEEVFRVDAVILATGYVRDVHLDMLSECQQINGNSDGLWIPGRDYQLNLNRDLVEDGVKIYLQGCNQETHGLSDTLLSILATRGGEIADSIFGRT